ncbi:hypothetical protein SNARM312S_08387 [Streptomyces narbonensis]
MRRLYAREVHRRAVSLRALAGTVRVAGWTGTSEARTGAPPAARGRRERLRAETTAEIEDTALRLMASGGPDAITLRAIAREMGMTANAIYGYFPTRDDLVTTLIDDVYSALADAVDAGPGRTPPPTTRPPGSWPGPAPSAPGPWPTPRASGSSTATPSPATWHRRADPPRTRPAGCAPASRGSPRRPGRTPNPSYRDSAFTWSDFDAGLLDKVRPAFPELPPAARRAGPARLGASARPGDPGGVRAPAAPDREPGQALPGGTDPARPDAGRPGPPDGLLTESCPASQEASCLIGRNPPRGSRAPRPRRRRRAA